MSAGQGIYHSEFNVSQTDTLKFLQIWIQPNQLGGQPDYQQKAFSQQQGLTTIITPNGTLHIKQNMQLIQLILKDKTHATWQTDNNRHYYVHVIEGELSLWNGIIARPDDGAKIEKTSEINFERISKQSVKALLFDLV